MQSDFIYSTVCVHDAWQLVIESVVIYTYIYLYIYILYYIERNRLDYQEKKILEYKIFNLEIAIPVNCHIPTDI